MPAPQRDLIDPVRSRQARRVAEECLLRRARGDSVSDHDLIAAHPDLMPELARELAMIGRIRGARQAAERPAASAAGSSAADSFATRVTAGGSRTRGDDLPAGALPGYEIESEIHRGGQGIVYQAIQLSTRRRVAVKVLKEGPFAGPSDRARFEREVQILGALNHPNIVTIYDSGSAQGLYYLAMDYIAGKALDQWMADSGLAALASGGGLRASSHDAIMERNREAKSRDQRAAPNSPQNQRSRTDATLRLFAKICDAINAAHLRGIIHRDLKPSNIRVDPSGEPHVLDFGLAKVSEFDVIGGSTAAAMTQTGQFVGSLPWAAPEQVDGQAGGIDTRTDVYALGVMLYQMFVGRFPYVVAGNVRDVIDNILTVEPQRPRTVAPAVNDEIETIILKCLSKEPARRYQTAGELGRDIERYLSGAPIEAKRDSGWYVLRKAVRRHRLPVGIAVGIVTLLVGSSVALFMMYQDQSRERHRAEEARRAAEAARNEESIQRARAEQSQARAEQETRKADAVNHFLRRMLASADPNESQSRDITVRELLDNSAIVLDAGELSEQPDVEASVRQTLGSTYRSLAKYADAATQLRKAFDMRKADAATAPRDVVSAVLDLAQLLLDTSDYSGAARLLAEHVDLVNRGTPDYPRFLGAQAAAMRSLGSYARAEELLREASALWEKFPEVEIDQLVSTLRSLANVRDHRGDYAESAALLRKALSMLEEADDANELVVASTRHELAEELLRTGDYAAAQRLCNEALEVQQRRLPDDHPTIAYTYRALAYAHLYQQRFPEAEHSARASLAILRKHPGTQQDNVATSLVILGTILQRKGDLAGAEAALREAIPVYESVLDPGHPFIATTLHNLGVIKFEAGDFAEAESLLLRALAMQRARSDADHPDILITLNWLAKVAFERANFAAAEERFRQILAWQRRTGASNESLSVTLAYLAFACIEQNHPDEGETLARDALSAAERTEPFLPLLVGVSRAALGAALSSMGRNEEAASHLCEGAPIMFLWRSATHQLKRCIAQDAMSAFESLGDSEQAAVWRAKLAELESAATQR